MYVPGFDDPSWPSFVGSVGSPSMAHRKPTEWSIPIEVKHEGSGSSSVSSSPPKEPRVCHIPITVEPRDSPATPPPRHGSSRPFLDSELHRPRAHSYNSRLFRQPEEVPTSPRMSSRARHSSGEKPHVTKIFVNQEQPSSPSPASKPTTPSTPPLASKHAVPPTAKPQEHRSLTKIKQIVKEIEDYQKKVEDFQGVYQDKQYRYLDEMLTRCLIMLDDVETDGLEDIRQARKSAIKMVESTISRLEARAHKEEEQDVEMAEPTTTEQTQEETSQPSAEQPAAELLAPIEEKDQTVQSSGQQPIAEESSQEEMQSESQQAPSALEVVTEEEPTKASAEFKEENRPKNEVEMGEAEETPKTDVPAQESLEKVTQETVQAPESTEEQPRTEAVSNQTDSSTATSTLVQEDEPMEEEGPRPEETASQLSEGLHRSEVTIQLGAAEDTDPVESRSQPDCDNSAAQL